MMYMGRYLVRRVLQAVAPVLFVTLVLGYYLPWWFWFIAGGITAALDPVDRWHQRKEKHHGREG
jgi:hypothetical protein